MTSCPKCGSDALEEREAERRSFYICRKCGKITYEQKTSSMGFESIVDDIAEGVAARGHHETKTVTLINTAFRAEPDRDSHSQMKEWAAKHLIRFERRGEMTCFQRDGIALNRLMRGA